MPDRDESAEEGAERVDRILDTPSARELREFVVDTIDSHSGERILSIGCGPGYEPASVAEHGAARVVGVDVSGGALKRAAERCADRPSVSLVRGDATCLPVGNGRVDAAVAKQVYQFVPDISAALRELVRVLKPGGRAVVVSPDADTDVMNTADRDRMQRVQEAYRNSDALPNPHLGSRLPSYASKVGLTVEEVEPYPVVQRTITDRVEQGITVHRQMAAAAGMDSSEVDAWEREQRELNEENEFLRSGTQFVYLLRKPP